MECCIVFGKLGPKRTGPLELFSGTSKHNVRVPYDDAMGSGSTDTSSDGFKSLLDINHQTPLDRRNVIPFAILIQNLQSTCIVLREERK